jgi:hypothetical protein
MCKDSSASSAKNKLGRRKKNRLQIIMQKYNKNGPNKG